ncbi:RNA-binding protein [cyanobacterium TDX16]|nr:RNA-binding protein [cyanobacterium TDX16]
MIFTHDTELSLQSLAALVNTLPSEHGDPDELNTTQELDAFFTAQQWSGARTHDQQELDAVRALRPRLRLLWTTEDEVALVDLVNALLVEYEALPQLVRHDQWDWHLHATSSDEPLAARMAVEAAMAMVDVIRQDEVGRMKICDADDCDDVLIDLSKNRSRRYCEGSCGNNANVAAYRARKAKQGSGGG